MPPACSMQVVICHNHVGSQGEIDAALTHELIHAYDHCRAADLDWSNLDHHACSEVQPPPIARNLAIINSLGFDAEYYQSISKRTTICYSKIYRLYWIGK